VANSHASIPSHPSMPVRQQASVAAAQIVNGMLDTFLHQNHRTRMQSQCLANKASKLAGNLVSTCGHTAEVLGRLLSNATMSAENKEVIDVQLGVYRIIQTAKAIVQTCMTNAVVDTMEVAAQHLRNLRYLAGHLVANDVDVMTELLGAMNAFNQGNSRAIGRHIGAAMRKVLPPTSSSFAGGLPHARAIEDMSEGLLMGFFGPGFVFSVQRPHSSSKTTDGVHLHSSSRMHATSHKMQTIWSVDLHRCVVGNLPLLQAAWAIMLHTLSQHTAGKTSLVPNGAAKAAAALIQLPNALRKCNIGKRQEVMLMDSMRAISQVHAKLELPSQHTKGFDFSQLFGAAAQNLNAHHWHECGEEIGKLLRLLIVKIFPERYEVSTTGQLQRHMFLGATWSAGSSTFLLLAASLAGVLIFVASPLARRLQWLRLNSQLWRSSRSSVMQTSTTEAQQFLDIKGSSPE